MKAPPVGGLYLAAFTGLAGLASLAPLAGLTGFASLASLAGCASTPAGGGAEPAPSFRFPADQLGIVRDLIETEARREDFLLPRDDDPARPEPLHADRLSFRKRIERSDFPIYKNLWANQVPFDPEWRVEFIFRADGESTRVVGYTYIRTREPPDGEWNEYPIREGHVSESVRSILERAQRLLPGQPIR